MCRTGRKVTGNLFDRLRKHSYTLRPQGQYQQTRKLSSGLRSQRVQSEQSNYACDVKTPRTATYLLPPDRVSGCPTKFSGKEVRSALIINGNEFTPCSHDCSSLVAQLERANAFERVQETSITSTPTDVDVFPDLILPRLLLNGGVGTELEVCRTAWPTAQVFALLCSRDRNHREKIPTLFYDVDDFLFCPYTEDEFLLRIKRLLKRVPESQPAQIANNSVDLLVGRSDVFLQAVREVGLFAQSKAPVVISGETGCGKELLARAIHYRSQRRSKPFIPVNCGALPDELFENELFGHLKGAYTSASTA